jgi:hypothetical protein
MKLKFSAVCLVMAISVSAVFAADLVGKVTFKGEAPPPQEIILDKGCADAAQTNKVLVTDYAIGVSNALAEVVVFIKENIPVAPLSNPVVVERKGCVYKPYITAVQVNQPILFRHSDPMMHNVFISPAPEYGNRVASLVQYAKAEDLKFKFTNPEPFLRIKSDFQTWLNAYIYVLPTPFFSVTDKDGAYKIADLPEGSYTVVAHHHLAGSQEKAVTIGQKNSTNDFVFAK